MSQKEFILFAATLMAIGALSIDAMLPAFNQINADLQITNPNRVQLVIGVLLFGLALGQLVCGPLADAYGRKMILYTTIGIYLVGTLIAYFAQSLDALLLGRFIQGVGAAGPNISASSLVRDNFKGRKMARVMSLVVMVFIMVPTIAPALGQLILLFADWRAIFALYAIYALALAVWIFTRLKETLSPDKRIPFQTTQIISAYKQVFSNHQTRFAMIASGCTFGCIIAYVSSSQQIIQEQLGAGKMYSIYFGMLALAIGAGSITNSRIVERIGMVYIASRALLVIALSSACFFVLQLFIHIELWMFLCYTGIFTASCGMVMSNLSALALEPMGHIAGTAAGVVGSTSSIMSIILGTLIGQSYDGTAIPFTIGVGVLALIAWKLVLLSKPSDQVIEHER